MGRKKIVIVGGGSFICNLINYIESMDEFDILVIRIVKITERFMTCLISERMMCC